MNEGVFQRAAAIHGVIMVQLEDVGLKFEALLGGRG